MGNLCDCVPVAERSSADSIHAKDRHCLAVRVFRGWRSSSVEVRGPWWSRPWHSWSRSWRWPIAFLQQTCRALVKNNTGCHHNSYCTPAGGRGRSAPIGQLRYCMEGRARQTVGCQWRTQLHVKLKGKRQRLIRVPIGYLHKLTSHLVQSYIPRVALELLTH